MIGQTLRRRRRMVRSARPCLFKCRNPFGVVHDTRLLHCSSYHNRPVLFTQIRDLIGTCRRAGKDPSAVRASGCAACRSKPNGNNTWSSIVASTYCNTCLCSIHVPDNGACRSRDEKEARTSACDRSITDTDRAARSGKRTSSKCCIRME